MKSSCMLVALLGLGAGAGASFAGAAEPAAYDAHKLSGRVLILAAASTTDAIEDIRREFARKHPAVTVRASYAASSTLARQVEAGAAADVFLSANRQWAQWLVKQRLVVRQRDLLGNRLVVIVPSDSPLEIEKPADLPSAKIRRLAMADAAAVPAGIYARQALEKLDLWKALKGKVTGAADVRQALQFVESGAAEAGIVYATDAAASKHVRVATRIDVELSQPIRYPLMLLEHGSDNPAAVAFYEYLGSSAAGRVFREHGFDVLATAKKAKPSE